MAVRGSTQTLTVTFYDAPGGEVEEPTGVSLTILYSGNTVIGPLTEPDIAHDGPGLYRYEWTIPADAEVGTYIVQWSGVLPGDAEPSIGYETLTVEAVDTTLPQYGGCLWPMDPACQDETWQSYSPEVQQRARALASATLQRLVGGRVAECPVKVRPNPSRGVCWAPPNYLDFHYGRTFTPLNWGGQWLNCVPCPPESKTVSLPAPVGRIDEVRVDGVVIPSSSYTVIENSLVWMGEGDAPWPSSQDVNKPDTEEGTFSVTYLNAYPVDSNGAYAVGLLALEFAKSCTNGKCRLPSNVTNIVRQGVSMAVVTGAFPGGLTGIREVDAYIALWNPDKLRQAPTVWSPDMARARRV
jgi:hypothetical protein